MNSDYFPTVPALGDYCFAASDIDLDENNSVKNSNEAAKTNNEEVRRGQKRGSFLVSEDDDGSQSSARKEANIHFKMIDDAEAEGRIDEKKASRLRNCLNSEDVVGLLLCEQIPAKRPGKGYHCRVCQVPLKGHVCPYCPVCSTSNTRFEKNDSHVCKNCIKCYDLGKKRKKLVQFSKQTCPCKESEVHGTKNQVSAS